MNNRELRIALDWDQFRELVKGSGIVVRCKCDESYPDKVIACLSEYQVEQTLNKSAWKRVIKSNSV